MNHRFLITSIVNVFVTAILLLPAPVLATTYYVDAANGDDAHTAQQATSAATAWKTIKTATLAAVAGDTILVQPGTYTESVESKRDGSGSAPITFRTNGAVIVKPPAGTPGFFVSHDHIIIHGFRVTGGTIGLRLGPHDGGDGPVAGLIARNNVITGNSNNGIQFSNAVAGVAEFNTTSQNGQNGVSYSGNGSQIHDNTANSNGQFGIYVKDGVNHQVWNNAASGNTTGDIKIQGETIPPPGSAPIGQRRFYIDGVNGDDARTDLQAQAIGTPWKTIKKGLQVAVAGETVSILPGVYAVNVQSLKDGAVDAPITIRAKIPGTVTIQPPSGSGVYLAHNYNIVDGVNVKGGVSGVQLGPYKTTNGTVTGLAVRNVFVSDATGAGIRFINALDSMATHSVVQACGKDGIYYSGNGAVLFNNLVFNNGLNLTGEYGITLASGSDHRVTNNTIYGNRNGGLRLGVSNTVPVMSTALDNIIVQNPIGVREPAGSDYTGHATVDYNDVYGNTTNYVFSKGSGTVKGPNSLSVAPAFVDPANGDFRLSRRVAGQAVDSLVINRGSDTTENLNLSGRTAFTDKYPDVDQVDLGYHGVVLNIAEGETTIRQATLTFDRNGQSFSMAANLRPDIDGDGIEVGTDFVQVSFGGYQYLLPIGDFTPSGSTWSYSGGNGVSAASLTQLGDGSVDLSLQVSGLALEAKISTSTSATVQIGDDFASAQIQFRGTLESQ